jgi:hypothetical protein
LNLSMSQLKNSMLSSDFVARFSIPPNPILYILVLIGAMSVVHINDVNNKGEHLADCAWRVLFAYYNEERWLL